jgi:hypothetical protein
LSTTLHLQPNGAGVCDRPVEFMTVEKAEEKAQAHSTPAVGKVDRAGEEVSGGCLSSWSTSACSEHDGANRGRRVRRKGSGLSTTSRWLQADDWQL